MYQILLLCFVPFILAQDRSLAKVRRAFDVANIPANTALIFDPTVLLEVTFPQKVGPPVTLRAGIQLPRNATLGPPVFSIANSHHSDSGMFVVAAVDPDAPTPQNPTSSQIRHFLGGNFRSFRGEFSFLSNSTPAISEFRQPTPPAGSPPHRYVFLLFEQPSGFDEKAAAFVNSTTPISKFNISAFAAEVGLGNPLGGTFMLVGPDPTA